MRLKLALVLVALITVTPPCWADFDTLVGNPPETEYTSEPKWLTLHRQARDAYEKNDLDAAEQLWKDAVWEAEHSNPPQIEPGVVNCLIGLSFLYDKRKNFPESERIYELAMRNMEGLVSRGHSRFADYMADLGDLYLRHGRADQAEVTYKELLESRQRKAEYDDEKAGPERVKSYLKYAESVDRYARHLHNAGMHTEAAPQENRAKAIRTSVQADPAKSTQ